MITQSHLDDINPGNKTTRAMNSAVHNSEHCVGRGRWKGVRAYIFPALAVLPVKGRKRCHKYAVRQISPHNLRRH